jgi:predicted regulator of Ras-like GTPase activity (Roadblock/LC7/MglB family)
MTGCDLHITAERSRNLKESLQELIDESGSLGTALLDQCGNRLSACGEMVASDDGVIAALAAGAFAATRELAARLGDPVFDGLVHHGRSRHFYLCSAGEDYLLLALFDQKTAAGVVRLCASRTASEIAALLDGGRTTSAAHQEVPSQHHHSGEVDPIWEGDAFARPPAAGVPVRMPFPES